MPAPIGLTVYSRLDHLRQTVAALQENTLASQSSLYIFSDGPRPGDEAAVDAVRQFIRSIDGFANVEIIERQENSRIANNRGGQRDLLDKFGEMIWMAEDIVTAPGFLAYMNAALDHYRDNGRIVSVSGYAPVIAMPPDYTQDIFFMRRFSAWGFGIWKDRYDRAGRAIDRDDYLRNIRNGDFYRKLVSAGEDIPAMINREVSGSIDALDVRIMYQQAVHDWYTVYPRRSLVQNIGHDGSGLHCGVSDRFQHDRLWDRSDRFVFTDNIEEDDRILSANRVFRRLGKSERIVEKMKHYYMYLCG